jgi:RHS repeat-associated protein
MGASPDGVGYTGHVNDPETGLVYMQARYYDAEAGRFLSVDPVGPTASNKFDFNRYAYVNDNPVRNIDPDGTTCTKADSGAYSCKLDGNTGKFSMDQVRTVNTAYTNTVNKLSSHPDVTVKVTMKGVSFLAKAGDVAKGLANAKVDTAPASSKARADTYGGGLSATSNYFLNYTPVITIYKNAVTSDRHRGTDPAHIKSDLERTFAHEGIHTQPRENIFYDVYKSDRNWDSDHMKEYNRAGDKLYDGGQ